MQTNSLSCRPGVRISTRRSVIARSRGTPQPGESVSYRVNRRIRRPEVRVINQNGEQLGVMPVGEAIRIAEAAGLDLVEVSPKANPPVCKIMDYGRFKYEKSKQAKAAKKNQSTVVVKEIKLRPKIDVHDLNVKIRRLERFLEEGHKVRLSVVFRGREIVHPETGQMVLQKVVDEMGEKLDIDHMPVMEGRRMVMIVAPKPGVVKKKSSKSSSRSADAVQEKGESAKKTGSSGPSGKDEP